MLFSPFAAVAAVAGCKNVIGERKTLEPFPFNAELNKAKVESFLCPFFYFNFHLFAQVIYFRFGSHSVVVWRFVCCFLRSPQKRLECSNRKFRRPISVAKGAAEPRMRRERADAKQNARFSLQLFLTLGPSVCSRAHNSDECKSCIYFTWASLPIIFLLNFSASAGQRNETEREAERIIKIQYSLVSVMEFGSFRTTFPCSANESEGIDQQLDEILRFSLSFLVTFRIDFPFITPSSRLDSLRSFAAAHSPDAKFREGKNEN